MTIIFPRLLGKPFVCFVFKASLTDHSDVKFLFISEDLENVPYIEVCSQDNFQAIRDFMLVPVVNAKHDTNTTIAKGDFASPAGVEIESTEWTWMSLQ